VQGSLSKPTSRDEGIPSLARLHLKVTAGPEIEPYFAMIDDSALKLMVEEQAFDPFSPQAEREVDFTDGSAVVTVNYRQKTPDVPVPKKELATLKGAFFIRAGVGLKSLSFPLTLENPQTRFCGSTAVTVLETMMQTVGVTLLIQVDFAPDVVWESHRQPLLHQAASLNLPDGTSRSFDKMELEEVRGSTHLVRYHFTMPASEHPQPTFVYRAAAIYRTAKVPVAMTIPILNSRD
jgi:hypothetical protein